MRFADGQLVRHKKTKRKGRIITALIDNGPYAAGVVFYEVKFAGFCQTALVEPRDLEKV